jgi:ribosomal protein S18 acetylase RimI-like enzyme
MSLGAPGVDHRDRADLYDHVERNGLVERSTARRALGMDRRSFGHHVAILRRDGLLSETDEGRLRIARPRSAGRERHRSEEFAYEIRPAREREAGDLVALMRATVDGGADVVAESVADVIDREDVLLRHNGLETRVFFLARVREETVGWLYVERPELEKLAHTAELTLGVLPEYRGHGIGSRLLERGLDWAADRGCARLYTSLPATNEGAIRFLRRNGWREEARRAEHYRIDGEPVDEVMLAVRPDGSAP